MGVGGSTLLAAVRNEMVQVWNIVDQQVNDLSDHNPTRTNFGPFQNNRPPDWLGFVGLPVIRLYGTYSTRKDLLHAIPRTALPDHTHKWRDVRLLGFSRTQKG